MAYFNLALIYETLHRLDDALRTYKRLIKLIPPQNEKDIQSIRERIKRLEERTRGEGQ